MGMDRNTVIGFVLLGLLLFAYLFISTKNSQEIQKQKQGFDDSVARVKASQGSMAKIPDSLQNKVVVRDTTGFNKAIGGSEKLLTVENDLLKIVFTNKGGQPKTVELKKFNSYLGAPIKLGGAENDRISYAINIGSNQAAQTSDLYFSPGITDKTADGTQNIIFQLAGPNGETITHQYSLKPDGYFVDYTIQLNGADRLLSQNTLNLTWQVLLQQQEKYVKGERQQSQICYLQDGDFDYHNLLSTDSKKFEKPVNWVSAKQQFFNITLIAKNNFDAGLVEWSAPLSDTLKEIAFVKANFTIKEPPGSSCSVPLQIYYGPTDYTILSNSSVKKMDRIVNLGQGFYSFVRPVNIFVIMPVFDFFKKFIGSYGVVIMLLTIFIRLLTSPLVYSSYLSGAKMKALRPEIEVMKKRVGGDQQQAGMEQMKLFREAGVNPLGGCIPALLQIPIFFALYSFFNSNIALRGQSFLWAKDLSVYDSVINLGFTVPLNFGNHISLFALLAVVTSFLISLYGMSMTPDQSNPAMKYMPYIMPVMLLLFFNSLPSALTWYYTVSNSITLILQFVIQNYIIDHDKILVKLQQNRSKPKTKSKWQERLEQMQESQKKVQQLKNKK
jgi:YidC/Oxa1 family membrane protein insertase